MSPEEIRERERELDAWLAHPVVTFHDDRAPGLKIPNHVVDLRTVGRFAPRYDGVRRAFYLQLPQPFADVRLYRHMTPTLSEWARLRSALIALGALQGD